MCKCQEKYDLDKTRERAKKTLKLIESDIIIYKKSSGEYNIVDAKCYNENLGEIIETLYYG